ncbi:hypothetical protein RKD54_004621 [Pseudarthrobacter sp. SLBN-100]
MAGGLQKGPFSAVIRGIFAWNPLTQDSSASILPGPGCGDRVFTDKASGREIARPQLTELVVFARDGDTVIIHSVDRLARNLDDLHGLVQGLTRKGVRGEFVKESLVFTG